MLEIAVPLKIQQIFRRIGVYLDEWRTGHKEHIVPNGAALLHIGPAHVGKGRGVSVVQPAVHAGKEDIVVLKNHVAEHVVGVGLLIPVEEKGS